MLVIIGNNLHVPYFPNNIPIVCQFRLMFILINVLRMKNLYIKTFKK